MFFINVLPVQLFGGICSEQRGFEVAALVSVLNLICNMSAYPFQIHLNMLVLAIRAHVAGENDEKHPAYIRFVSLTVFAETPLSSEVMCQG